MIFQNPKASLNPFTTVGSQITEAIQLHTDIKDPLAGQGAGHTLAEQGEDRHPRGSESTTIPTASRAACVKGP